MNINFNVVEQTFEFKFGEVFYLGSTGDTYTKAEIDSKLEQKLDKPDENDWANFLAIITGE